MVTTETIPYGKGFVQRHVLHVDDFLRAFLEAGPIWPSNLQPHRIDSSVPHGITFRAISGALLHYDSEYHHCSMTCPLRAVYFCFEHMNQTDPCSSILRPPNFLLTFILQRRANSCSRFSFVKQRKSKLAQKENTSTFHSQSFLKTAILLLHSALNHPICYHLLKDVARFYEALEPAPCRMWFLGNLFHRRSWLLTSSAIHRYRQLPFGQS